MKNSGTTEATQQYAAAHEAHYTTKELVKAIGLYRAIIDDSPETKEAEYSRSQIQNIVNALVSKQELLDIYVNLALQHLDGSAKSNEEVRPVA